MENHKELARGYKVRKDARTVGQSEWNELTEICNAFGPLPHRSSREWKRVWAELKQSIKKKVYKEKNHRKCSGGDGPFVGFNLTPLEDSVVALCALVP